MLLMHGDQDVIVPIKQSEIMESALKQAVSRSRSSECREASTVRTSSSRPAIRVYQITWEKRFGGSMHI